MPAANLQTIFYCQVFLIVVNNKNLNFDIIDSFACPFPFF